MIRNILFRNTPFHVRRFSQKLLFDSSNSIKSRSYIPFVNIMSLHKYVLYGATLTIGSNVLVNFVMLEKSSEPDLEKSSEPCDAHLQKLMKVLEKYTDNPEFVYKSVIKDGEQYIIVLERLPITETNEKRPNVMDKRYAKFRGNAFRTIAIINAMNPDKTLCTITNHEKTKTIYDVGQVVVPDGYDKDISQICCKGIHFFRDPLAAYYYNFKLSSTFTGKYLEYYDNGSIYVEYTFVNGIKSGKTINYFNNGKTRYEATYVGGKISGKYWVSS